MPHICESMICLIKDDKKEFTMRLEETLEKYKVDCMSFADGFKDKPEELFCFDCLGVAKLAAIRGWEIDIKHEKFPEGLFELLTK